VFDYCVLSTGGWRETILAVIKLVGHVNSQCL